ncbi:MAG: 50S ribosomal protein L32 [Anaerolineae bacterium]|nr:50S ribosomal protein L32 [Anaerolineae bacterium]
MGAVPKRKLSRGRTARRRSHMALQPMNLVPCPQCHEMHRPHHICPGCGMYRGRQVIPVKAKAPRSESAT